MSDFFGGKKRLRLIICEGGLKFVFKRSQNGQTEKLAWNRSFGLAFLKLPHDGLIHDSRH